MHLYVLVVCTFKDDRHASKLHIVGWVVTIPTTIAVSCLVTAGYCGNYMVAMVTIGLLLVATCSLVSLVSTATKMSQ